MGKFLIECYTKKELKQYDRDFEIPLDITERQIGYLKYLKEGLCLKFDEFFILKNEEFYSKVLDIIRKIISLNKFFIIKIMVEKRSHFEKILPELRNSGKLQIIINYDLYDYSFQEYYEEEIRLNKMISNLRNSNLSPLERYMGVYNIVKRFKPYKENNLDSDQSRKIRFILNNKYIVCVGFAKLMEVLLDKVGIESTGYSVSTYRHITDEDNVVEGIKFLGGHKRLLVNIKDEKYKINGYYIADPTWDNSRGDTWTYSLITHDCMQKNELVFFLGEKDFVFDVHDFNEFYEKVNKFLRKKCCGINDKKIYESTLLDSYFSIYIFILGKFRQFDFEEYKNLHRYRKIKQERTKSFYKTFLNKVGYYIVSKVNNEIDLNVLAHAITKGKTYNWIDDPTFIEAYEDHVYKQEQERKQARFPYQFSESNISGNKLEYVKKKVLQIYHKP